MTKKLSADDFLKITRPIKGVNFFAVGVFETGITLYRQQIRALNLIYAMTAAKAEKGEPLFARGTRVAIVGGGAFGITAAIAARAVGFEPYLFEFNQDLLSVQRNCDTRWITPLYYEWPIPGSEQPSARLPFFDWHSGTAAKVAQQIETRFKELNGIGTNPVHCLCNIDHLSIEPSASGFDVTYVQPDTQNEFAVSAVIYAAGFGREAVDPSYWRNDDLGQTKMGRTAGEKITYVVSGVGDGGLTDLFRLTIRDFRHEQIFDELFGGIDEDLLATLRKIQTSTPRLQENVLFDRLFEIAGDNVKTGQLARVFERLDGRLRTDTEVILNGKESSPRACAKLGRISFSNGLLLYLLFRLRAFNYCSGAVSLDETERRTLTCDGETKDWPWPIGQSIFRHGTDRAAPLKSLGFGEAVGPLKAVADEGIDTGQKIYPDGWWSAFLPGNAEMEKQGYTPHVVEYVPTTTIILGTAFISTLANALKDIDSGRGEPRKFRLTLHRLAIFNGQDHFQQVTPYSGRIDKQGGVGRIFPVTGGIVGLASRTGSLVVCRKEDQKEFDEVWRLTKFDTIDAREIERYVDAIIACPFFAPRPEGSTAEHVTMVLFADSAHRDFFTDDVLKMISSACTGFVQTLELLSSTGTIRSLSTEYRGFKVKEDAETNALVARLKELHVAFDDANFPSYRDDLTFKTVRSLDLELGLATRLAESLQRSP